MYRMNYQKIICWGDSQTFGARSYGCYPLYLSQILTSTTQYTWQVVNFSTNGHTVRDLWFRLQHELLYLKDSYLACILIGANDVGNQSPAELFEEYYRQILYALEVGRFHVVYCGEIPPIWPDGHPFFSSASVEARQKYNELIKQVVEASSIARLVEFPELNADCYTDPVHLNETGNKVIADSFAKAIRSF